MTPTPRFSFSLAARQVRLVVALVLILPGASAVTAAAAPEDALRFTYDDNGRLTGVVDPANGSAAYRWDKVGNLLSIARFDTDDVAILQLAPNHGSVGSEVTIHGTGFSTTAVQNTVEFNGQPASVESSTLTEIVATVPSGATTGPVSVAAPGGTATTEADFVVVDPPAPQISGISPSVAVAGDSVTVTGSGFESSPANNRVTVNRSFAELTSATTSALQLTVPNRTGSGRVKVATPEGEAEGPDLFIPPAGYTAGQVEPTDRVAAGHSKTLNFAGPDRIGMLVFDGEAGDVALVSATAVPGATALSLYGPDGQQIGNLSVVDGQGDDEFLPATRLPRDGTYTVLIDPGGGVTGSITLALSTLEQQLPIVPTPEGTSRELDFPDPGLFTQMVFDASAGDVVSLVAGQTSISATVSIREADGTLLQSGTFDEAGDFQEGIELPRDGSYRIVVDPDGNQTGSMSLTAYLAAAVDITPTQAGVARTVDLQGPGLKQVFRFEGDAGGRIAVKTSPGTLSSGGVLLISPTGELLATDNVGSDFPGERLFERGLAIDGTYKLVLDASADYTGTTHLTFYDASDLTEAIEPSPAGDSTPLTFSTPGQRARLSFDGEAGQVVSLRATNVSTAATVSIRKADGTTLDSRIISQTGDYVDGVELPDDGDYQILVDPPGLNTGALTLTAYLAEAVEVTPTEAGAPLTVDLPAPGLKQVVRFEGEAGQRIAVKASPGTLYQGSMGLFSPTGDLLGQDQAGTLFPTDRLIDPVTLPVDGTYKFVLDPIADYTGSTHLTFYDAPADITGTLEPSPTGDSTQLTFSTPGQRALLDFDGEAGQVVSLQGTQVSTHAVVSIRKADGTSLGSWIIGQTGDYTNGLELPEDGAYRIVVDPQEAETGALTLTAFLAEPIDVTPTEAGEPVEVEFNGPGLQQQVHFDGETGQQVAVEFSEMTIYEFGALLRSPSEQPLASGVFGTRFEPTEQSLQTVELGATGTHSLLVDPSGDYTGAVTATFTLVNGQQLAAARFVRPGSVAASERRKPLSGKPKPRNAGQPARKAPRVARHQPTLQADPGRAAAPRPKQQRHRSRSPALPPGVGGGLASGVGLRAAENQAPSPRAPWIPTQRNRTGNWLTHRQAVPVQDLPPLTGPTHTTAVTGQTLELDGRPLRGLRVSIEGQTKTVRTDRTGRFVLTSTQSGKQVLVVDGRTADGHGRRFGLHEIGVDLRPDRTTALDFPIWMSQLDREGDLRVKSPTRGETVLKSPRIPGLEVRIPAGSRITDRDGHPVSKLNLTAIPIDRPPFPLPPHTQVPIYFTAQPGGAYLSKGAQIIYPNYSHLPAGQRVRFWQYDPDDRGWFVYGRGTVSDDQKQVVPDRDVRIWEFTGAMISGEPPPPDIGPNPFDTSTDGDPVDLGTGLFVYRKLDLYIPDTIPIALQRTYRQEDGMSYAFGRGTTNAYDLRLYSIENYQKASLILPDGGQVQFIRTSGGTGFADAVYRAPAATGPWHGAELRWSSEEYVWHLETRDGTVYVFGEFAPLIAVRDRFGQQLSLTRSGGGTGPITRITSPSGHWIELNYDASNRVTEARDNAGRTVAYEYNADGWLENVTDPEGHETHFAYESTFGLIKRMTEITDGRGITYLQNTYETPNCAGTHTPKLVASQTLADGGTYDFDWVCHVADNGGFPSYDGLSRASVTDPVGTLHTVNFSSTSRQGGFRRDESWSRDGETKTFQFERNPNNGQLTSVTDPLDRRTIFSYDGDGNLTARTDLAGTDEERVSQWSYDPRYGQLASYTDPLGHTTNFERDGLGRLTAVEDPTSRRWTFGYTGRAALPTSITDPAEETTELGYSSGQLSLVRDPLGNETNIFRDSLGRPVATSDPVGRRTRFSYDDTNLLERVTAPDGGETNLDYDANGNLTELVDPRGGTWSMTYDSMDRLASETDPLDHTSTYEYDLNGNMVKETDRRGKVTSLRYDAFNRPTFAGFDTTGDPGDEEYESTIDYSWDGGDRLIAAGDSAGGAYTSSYDDLDRLLSETGPDGTVSYTYDDADRPLTMDVPDQDTTTYSWDDGNRLTGLTRGGTSVEIAHDDLGRRSTTTLPNGIVGTLSWDAASRLTGIDYALGATDIGDLNYEYNNAGERVASWGSLARVGLPDPIGSTSYDAANHRTAQDGATLSYDQEGNLTDDGDTTYSWDARGQLASLTGSSGTTTFGYDPFGRRNKKTSGGSTRSYLHDGSNVVQELTDGSPTADLLSGLAPDDLFARTTDGGTDSYLRDALGSTLTLMDSTGLPETSYTYGPFGETGGGGSPPPDGLVGAWGFDEASGSTAEDRSEAGNDGSVSGATWSTDGKYGGALSFDGTDDRVVVPDSASLDLDDEMTLQAWVKPSTQDGHWQAVLLKEWNGDFLAYDISTGDGAKPFGAAYMSNDDSLAVSEAPDALADNTWTHLAVTYNGSDLKFFVNGSQVASEPASGPIQTTGGDLTIGGTAVFSDQWFDGLIDEVRVYNRALTATEIQTDKDTAISTIGAAPGAGGPGDNPYQFTGRENDGNGLSYYRARYYSPDLKRFISEDPIGFAGGDTNLQAYVGNSPLTYIDPYGLFGVGDVTGAVSDSYDWVTDQAEQSVEFYANWANHCGSATACGLANVGGWFSSLATRKNLPATAATLSLGWGWGLGLKVRPEWNITKRIRIAPFGAREGGWWAKAPHYHRGRYHPNGRPIDGHGKGRHRPWESKSQDTSFWDRLW